MDEGLRLVAASDVVAIPSTRSNWSRGQLPAKLIDAMMLGRAIVATSTGPIAWALGTAGLLVPPDDLKALKSALERLRDPQLRLELGAAARDRAEKVFSVAVLSEVFRLTCERELLEFRRRSA